jgi:hypothetical protein
MQQVEVEYFEEKRKLKFSLVSFHRQQKRFVSEMLFRSRTRCIQPAKEINKSGSRTRPCGNPLLEY